MTKYLCSSPVPVLGSSPIQHWSMTFSVLPRLQQTFSPHAPKTREMGFSVLVTRSQQLRDASRATHKGSGTADWRDNVLEIRLFSCRVRLIGQRAWESGEDVLLV
jgi:hypothetical protein